MAIESVSHTMPYQSVQPTGKPSTKPEGDDAETAVQEVLEQPTTAVQTGRQEENETDSSASADQIKRAVDKLNKKMSNSEAIFGIHEGTNRVMIRIVDKKTKETIKELPPEKTLDMIAKAWELAGLLVDERR